MVDLFESSEVFPGHFKGGVFEGGGPGSTVAPIFGFDDPRFDCFYRLSQKIQKEARLVPLFSRNLVPACQGR